ncbi:MAG: DUF3365 domain-containing protein [Magnetospirillum sp.]|nr:DUF3365 domain-containing protein [Magnetospirillum sp.]
MSSRLNDKTSTGAHGRVAGLVVAALTAWSLLIGGSAAWNHQQQHDAALALAFNTAKAHHNKDLAYRLWASSHGGVYVDPTEKTPPSPWMAHLPDRDLVTVDGRKLTLMNPAYMLREMMADFGDLYGIKGRIVGIVYLNPNNKADAWEEAAIRQFGTGTSHEITEISELEGAPYLRLIRPMIMEASCQKCHGHLGFKNGEIRGAISVSVPLAPYLAAEANSVRTMFSTHAALWLVGALAIIAIGRNSARRMDNSRRAALALQHSERRFRDMAEAIDQVFFVAEVDFSRFHYISPAFNRIWGWDGETLLANPRNWLRWLHPDDSARIAAFVAGAIGSGEYSADFRILRPDGQIRWLHAKAFEINDADGHRQVVGFQADITYLKTIEEELRAKNSSLEHSNAELESFAYVASHDLREPLRNVTSFSSLLERRIQDRLDGEEREFLKFIKDGATRMDALICDLLEFSRVGRDEQAMKPVAMAEVVKLALNTLQARIMETGATVEITTSLPEIFGSRSELCRMVVNLIGNAIKYSRQDVPIVIRIACVADGKDWHFQVQDNGIGIENGCGYEERIFRLFQRLHQRTEYGGGTGVGLAVCRKTAERHGGRMWVQSDGLGKGSTFHFTLPALGAA